ncbi:FtsX-like permease family protein [Psychromicrobium xiongbiense]|uniref:FtsX-like permease family protein n=1 Tax=Psychromicrobium xiongbiense TaxID=3051184 RepID=UPI0025564148|nr:ABC transporter permease [Psychromicrobium sp. YIM S02556]
MFSVAWGQFRLHSRRFIAVALAVLLAVAFLVATLLVNSSTQATLKASVGQSFAAADAIAEPAGGETFSQEAVDAVAHLPGVTTSFPLQQLAATATANGHQFSARVTTLAPTPALNSAVLVTGSLPGNAQQIALDERTAGKYALQPGTRLELSSSHGVSAPVTVSGIVQNSNEPGAAGTSQLVAPAALMASLGGSPAHYSSIQFTVPGGLSPAVRQSISEALAGAGAQQFTVRTADEQTTAVITRYTGGADALSLVLLAFATIALVVAVLVVANTFSVLVAQRTRELALLRCVGAGKRQIGASVVLEAAIVGATASLLGIVVAIGGMWGLLTVLRTLPDTRYATLAVPWQAPLAGLVVGVLMTVLAALVPARAATSVAPLAALRPAKEATVHTRGGRVRLILGFVLLLGGALLLGVGALRSLLLLALPGGALTFLGVLLCSSIVIPPLISWVGRLAAPAGVPGKLAALNAVRNPGRTTATASALLIGVTLVSMMLTGASTARTAFDSTLDQRYPVDISVAPGTYSAAQLAAARSVQGVSAAAQLPVVGTAEESGVQTPVYGIGTSDAAAMLHNAANHVTPGSILMPRGFKGSATEVTTAEGHRQFPVKVAASPDVVPLVSLDDVPAPSGAQALLWFSVDPKLSGGQIMDLRSSLAQALGVQEAMISGGAVGKASFHQVIDLLLLVVVGLLAIAILIALIGVANTLSLSILERTRENALLRALGLSRGSLRGMLALEAVLIAGVAALLGVVLGLLYGWLGAQSALGAFATVAPTVPWLELLAVVAVATVAGLRASVIPARKAARLSPVAGLASD